MTRYDNVWECTGKGNCLSTEKHTSLYRRNKCKSLQCVRRHRVPRVYMVYAITHSIFHKLSWPGQGRCRSFQTVGVPSAEPVVLAELRLVDVLKVLGCKGKMWRDAMRGPFSYLGELTIECLGVCARRARAGG